MDKMKRQQRSVTCERGAPNKKLDDREAAKRGRNDACRHEKRSAKKSREMRGRPLAATTDNPGAGRSLHGAWQKSINLRGWYRPRLPLTCRCHGIRTFAQQTHDIPS